MSTGGNEADTDHGLPSLPGDQILVWMSNEFRQKSLGFLTEKQLDFVVKEMPYSVFSGVYCERTQLFVKSFPIPVQVAVPPKFKIFYTTGRLDQQPVVGLIKTGVPDAGTARKISKAAGEMSYAAGKFFDGMFGLSGRS